MLARQLNDLLLITVSQRLSYLYFPANCNLELIQSTAFCAAQRRCIHFHPFIKAR